MRDAHVVGNYICDKAHTMALDMLGKFPEVFLSPNFGVEFAMVGNVITVQTPGASHQEWGCITVADSERIQVINHMQRIAERERAAHLQAVCR